MAAIVSWIRKGGFRSEVFDILRISFEKPKKKNLRKAEMTTYEFNRSQLSQ
jgi:hypothetical protein